MFDSIEKQRQHNYKLKYLYTINYAINNKNNEIAPYLALSEANNSRLKFLDTIYNVLDPKIKASKYGRSLQKHIANIKSGKID